MTPHAIEPPPPPPSEGDPTHRISIDSFESTDSDSHSSHGEFDPIPIPDSQNESQTHDQTQAETQPADSDTVIQPYAHTSIPPDTQTTVAIGNRPLHKATPTNNTNEVVDVAQVSTSHVVSEEDGAENGVEREREAEGDREREGEREAEGEREGERERRSALFDVEGDSEGNEEGPHTLFEPTSPLHLMPTGILHDIAEETEGDTECERSWNGREEAHPLPQLAAEDDEIEYGETEFFDAMDTTATSQDVLMIGTSPAGVAPPPCLPVSPPPGPVLSPRLSMLLAETNGTNINGTPSPHQSTTDYQNRLSVASQSGDSPPPPLPSSLPPGKLISPRHSLMDSDPSVHRPNSILGNIGTRLDTILLSDRILTATSDGEVKADSHDSIPQTPVQAGDMPDSTKHFETESDGDEEEPLLITTIDEVDDPAEEELDESGEPLPPPLEDPPTRLGESKLKITPSFLRSLEPPREFSDSGLPDTDHLSTPEQGIYIHRHEVVVLLN